MHDVQLLTKIDELQVRLRTLAQENAALRYERDVARCDLRALTPKATADEEAAYRQSVATAVPGGLASLIVELEAGGAGRVN